MKRLPIGELLVQKTRPLTTLSLVPSFCEHAAETVESYIFTDTIRSHVETILESVVRGAGQGFWVQAEYGAGKTHFLGALAALLSDTSDELWARVSDDGIRHYRARLRDTRLLPVVLSLRGESQADALTEQTLLDVVLEKGLRPALERVGLHEEVQLTAADDLLEWLDRIAPPGTKGDIEGYVLQKTGRTLAAYRSAEGGEATARLVSAWCAEHGFTPRVAAGVKSRLAHIYRQITAVDHPRYNGLLFVIDEYEGWEKNRSGPSAASQDAEFLETLAYLLPKDLGFQVHTIVASQSAAPAKLVGGQEGDRFIHVPLLADRNTRDYDVIISRRVRGLRPDRLPEVNDHYTYYRDKFDFARALSDGEFADTFPFQPRCFEVVRRITARDLPTARSGILVFHEIVSQADLLARDTLIRVSDLLASQHLVGDCLMTPVYKEAFNAYRAGKEALPALGLEAGDLALAEESLGTLFLWYLAYMENPRPMPLRDLAQATLTVDDFMKADDAVAYVLLQMQALQQIAFDGKSASFVPKGTEGFSVTALFNDYRKRAAGDPYRVTAQWTSSLFLNAQATRGQPGLFSEFTLGEATARRIVQRNLEYPGQVVVASRWQFDWGLALPKDDTHFRLVIMTPDAAQSVKAAELQDRRIAVIYPAPLSDAASQAAVDYLAWEMMDGDYRNQSGKEAEAVREWLAGRRSTYLNALLQTHLGLYRAGTIITRDELAISARDAFGQASNEQRLTFVVDKLLTAAYDQLPLDAARLRSTLTGVEAGKVFDGYLSKTPSAAQATATRNYGVGLGLSHPDQPARFAPQPDCKALALIAQSLAERKGAELPVWRVYEHLSTPPYGLPYVAIQLYLFAFVRRNEPRVELVLKRDHNLKARDGRPFGRERVTPGTVAELAWKAGSERAFEALLPVAGPSWNDALTYGRELVGDLRTSTDQADIEGQSARLERALEGLALEIEGQRATLETLERTLGGTLPAGEREACARLREMAQASGDGYVAFYEQAQAQFATPDDLRDALRVHSRLRELAGLAAQINEVKRYLEAAQFRPEHRELKADRDALKGQIVLEALAAQPSRWGSLQAQFDQFKGRYRNEYHKHHRDTNSELAQLAAELEDAPRRLRALALLDSIVELGAPRGTSLHEQYDRVAGHVAPCPVADYRLVDVEAAPACAQCHRSLTDIAPQEEVRAFLRVLSGALGEQTRRLSGEAIRRVLARSDEDAVAQFLKVVQTANVAALVEVLDEELVRLIRELLAGDGIATTEVDVLRRWAREYPALEEGDLDAAVGRFGRLLREAFEQARKEHPGKSTVRLTLR